MVTPAISIRNVTKVFTLHNDRRTTLKERFVRGAGSKTSHFRALDDVSFDIPRGSTFGLIGHNGSGKSTMLKVLAGVYRPTSGQVLVDGRVSALLELGAGFHGELTGRENIFLNGAILGMSKKEIHRKIDRIIDFADVGDFIDTPVKVYSSGMTVRLGFAIAITLDPEILIVDEIIAVGDEDFQRKCFDYLFDLRKKGTTIALVTHSLGLASQLCDEALWLDHGKTRMQGKVGKVIDGYLAAVNAREADRRAEEDAASADGEAPVADGVKEEESDAPPRQGSGEARVEDVEILKQNGDPAPFVVPGYPYTFRVHVQAKKPVDNVEVGLAIVHENGMTVAGPNSVGQAKRRYHIPTGRSYVDYHVDSMIIQPGSFAISAALVDSGHIYDYRDRETPLTVRADTAVYEPGLIRMLGTWSKDVSDPVLSGAVAPDSLLGQSSPESTSKVDNQEDKHE